MISKQRQIYLKAWRKANPNYQRKWDESHPDYQNDRYRKNELYRRQSHCRHLMRSYNISLTEFRELAAKQNHKCLICDKKKKLVVDHDHKTGEVRGLLCIPCNARLSMFDDKKLFNKILKYLGGK